jgi:hypothetical protein
MISLLKNKHLAFCLIIPFLLLQGCQQLGVDCETYDYSDCLLEEPNSWELCVNLTINSENPEVKVTFFKGDFQNKDTLWSGYWSDPEICLELPVEQEYSVVAEYLSGSRKILAVDGDRMRTSSRLVCEKKCWRVKGAQLDARLLP